MLKSCSIYKAFMGFRQDIHQPRSLSILFFLFQATCSALCTIVSVCEVLIQGATLNLVPPFPGHVASAPRGLQADPNPSEDSSRSTSSCSCPCSSANSYQRTLLSQWAVHSTLPPCTVLFLSRLLRVHSRHGEVAAV